MIAFEVALFSVAVDRQFVPADVAADLDERPDARHELVACAQLPAELPVVAISVARRRAVGEFGILVPGALGDATRHQLQAVEALRDARAEAERHVYRQLGEVGRQVRAARIVGREEEPAVEIELGVARHVDAVRDLGVDQRAVQRRRLIVGGVAAAQAEREFVARPERAALQFRRDHGEGRTGPAEHARGIAVVAAHHVDRRPQQKAADADAGGLERVLVGRGRRPAGERIRRPVGVGVGRARGELRGGAAPGRLPRRHRHRPRRCGGPPLGGTALADGAGGVESCAVRSERGLRRRHSLRHALRHRHEPRECGSERECDTRWAAARQGTASFKRNASRRRPRAPNGTRRTGPWPPASGHWLTTLKNRG